MQDTFYIPTEHLLQIAEQAPRALRAYIFIWQCLDKDFTAQIEKDWLVNNKSLSWTLFKNDVRALARIGLLEWHEDSSRLNVTLADPSSGFACA